MPELPEVEVVRRGLDPAIRGAQITAVTVHDSRALTRHEGDAADFESDLAGRTLCFGQVEAGVGVVAQKLEQVLHGLPFSWRSPREPARAHKRARHPFRNALAQTVGGLSHAASPW